MVACRLRWLWLWLARGEEEEREGVCCCCSFIFNIYLFILFYFLFVYFFLINTLVGARRGEGSCGWVGLLLGAAAFTFFSPFFCAFFFNGCVREFSGEAGKA